MNVLFTIRPYRHYSVWAFDDKSRGLLGEPFVGNINVMIDWLCSLVGSREITLLFSDKPFPDYQLVLHRDRPEHGGAWYFMPTLKIEGWLCSALFKYFEIAPKNIYIQAIKN